MSMYSMMGFLFTLILVILQSRFSHSATIVVDGVSEWKDPTVQNGDSVIFQHKYHYNLYIFRNERAFNICNFTEASLLTKAHSTSYIWHPSRKGFFYFSFNNGSDKACQEGEKLAVKVIPAPPPPENEATAPPDLPPAAEAPRSPGGVVSSSPAFPWPFRPREATNSPSPSPSDEMFPATSPMVPDQSGGIPFITSNPAVPIPTGEVDSATIRPFQIPSCSHDRQVNGILAAQRALCCSILVMLL